VIASSLPRVPSHSILLFRNVKESVDRVHHRTARVQHHG